MSPGIAFAAQQLCREIIWHLCNRSGSIQAPAIAVFGSRRSGTTWMMEVIAANRGFKYVDQPLSVFTASPYQLRRIPIFPGGQPFDPSEEEQSRIHSYVADILEGRIHVNEPWRVWRPEFSFRPNRIVLKLTNAHGIAEWLNARFSLNSIVVMRHPIAQSLSVIRNAWGSQARAFLSNEKYCETFLDRKQVDFMHDTMRSSTLLHQYVADWCLENLPLIRSFPGNPDWYFVTYEHFVQNCSEVIAEWADAYDLPSVEVMKKAAGRPSKSTKGLSEKQASTSIAVGDQEKLLGGWRAKVDDETDRSVMKILEVLEIDLYRAGSNSAVLGCRPTRQPQESARFPSSSDRNRKRVPSTPATETP